jgi:hypothetical protein
VRSGQKSCTKLYWVQVTKLPSNFRIEGAEQTVGHDEVSPGYLMEAAGQTVQLWDTEWLIDFRHFFFLR